MTGWHCPRVAWAICSALSEPWSSVPSSSSLVVFSWEIRCVFGDWLVFPPTSNPFVVCQISFPEFFVWKLPFNCSISCHFSCLKQLMMRCRHLLQPASSDSTLPCLPFCASDWWEISICRKRKIWSAIATDIRFSWAVNFFINCRYIKRTAKSQILCGLREDGVPYASPFLSLLRKIVYLGPHQSSVGLEHRESCWALTKKWLWNRLVNFTFRLL